MSDQARVVATGVAFGEGPRWHDGALWWSDMHADQVSRLGEGGVERVCTVPNQPSGLGWLPDGRLLVVSMLDRRVLRQEPDGSLVTHADASAVIPKLANDMVVDRHGRAYVGNFGFDLSAGDEVAPTVLLRADPDGSVHVVADELLFPNGMVLTDDGRTLIVGETWGGRLTAFDVAEDGGLSGRRVWALMTQSEAPDGICLDAEGAVWVASPPTKECVRVREGGEVTQRIDVGRGAFACMLGGADRHTLFVCTADSYDPARQRRERNGRIEAFEVAVPGAGLP